MKRWAIRILLFLLLGAIVNVVVAWALVQYGGDFSADTVLSWTPAHDSLPFEADTAQLAELGWIPIPIGDRPLAGGKTVEVRLHLDVAVTFGVSIRIVTEEEGCEIGTAGVGYNRTAIATTSAGWPCLGLRGLRFDASSPSARQAGRSSWQYRNAIPRPAGGNQFFWNTLLPLRPLWPGFAINTVFYAFVLWLLFAGPFVVRRWRRIRRGLCPKCAYDLRGTEANICPECGAIN